MPPKSREASYDKPTQPTGAEKVVDTAITVAAYVSGALALAGVVAYEAIRGPINPAPPTQQS